jgi:cation diffusion facilitator CzcD-associated flavoprotein CzcO
MIRDYIREAAAQEGLLPHIRLGHRVEAAHWDSGVARWTVDVRHADAVLHFSCRLLFFCSG